MKIRKVTAAALVCVIGQPAFTSISISAQTSQSLPNQSLQKNEQTRNNLHGQQDDFWRRRAIKHLVVIFDENISFDHYFGTYPHAMNPAGEPAFHGAEDTPTVNGLSGALLTSNPNALNTANGTGAINPFRLDRSQAWTADQGHSYAPEQVAVDKGLMDLFPKSVGVASKSPMPVPSRRRD